MPGQAIPTLQTSLVQAAATYPPIPRRPTATSRPKTRPKPQRQAEPSSSPASATSHAETWPHPALPLRQAEPSAMPTRQTSPTPPAATILTSPHHRDWPRRFTVTPKRLPKPLRTAPSRGDKPNLPVPGRCDWPRQDRPTTIPSRPSIPRRAVHSDEPFHSATMPPRLTAPAPAAATNRLRS